MTSTYILRPQWNLYFTLTLNSLYFISNSKFDSIHISILQLTNMKKQAMISAEDLIENCESVAQIMKALAHPQRLMLLCHLSMGEKTVGELENLCSISQSLVSQFLSRMKLEGLVTSEKRGLFVYYVIANPKVKKLMTSLQKIFCS